MSELLLKEILSQQQENGRIMSRIEALLGLALLRDKNLTKNEILKADEESVFNDLADAVTTLSMITERSYEKAEERHNKWLGQQLDEFDRDWVIQGAIECHILWEDTEDPQKRRWLKDVYRGSIKMADMKNMLYAKYLAPKNATDLNRKLIAQVKHYIREGKLPDSGVFKKIKNAQTRARGREFPSRAILSKNDFMRFTMLYSLTWGYRKKPEDIAASGLR